MYNYHYKYIKNKYDAKLLFADTNSLVYEIKTEDFYKIKICPLNSKCFDPVDKKVTGKMKDEYKGKIICEFSGLKSKMYSLISVDDEELPKAK